MIIKREKGFTLIEILMVLVLIGILAAVAINSFVNFSGEAKTAALQSNLAALRASIAAQYAQMQLRCDTLPGVFPPLANLTANNITTAASPCTTVQVSVVSEREFVTGGIPNNPWSTPLANTITACSAGAGCTIGDVTACDGTAVFTEDWCYDAASGIIWADSGTALREAL